MFKTALINKENYGDGELSKNLLEAQAQVLAWNYILPHQLTRC